MMSWSNKLVRDLSWAIQGAKLLQEGNSEAEAAWAELCCQAHEQLCELDNDPTPLERFMEDDGQHATRLQSYFAALVHFWLLWGSYAQEGTVHPAIWCNLCGAKPIEGFRYTRQLPSDTYDVCSSCYSQLTSAEQAKLQRVARPVASRLPLVCKRLVMQLRLLAQLSNGLCLHCEPSVSLAISLDANEDTQSLGRLVTVDLETNLQQLQQLNQFKCSVAEGAAVSGWAQEQLGASRMAGFRFLAGDIYQPLAAHTQHWWCASVGGITASAAADSMWALVELRHMLGPSRVVHVAREEMSFTKKLDGTPMIVPPAGSAPAESAPAAPLRKGDRGSAVQALQILLVQVALLEHTKIRYRVGVFGDNTTMAVGALQSLYNIPPTGDYCQQTAQALSELISKDSERVNDWLEALGEDQPAQFQVVQGSLPVLLPHARIFPASELEEVLSQQSTDPTSKAADEGPSGAMRAATEQLTALMAGSGHSAVWVHGLSSCEQQQLCNEAACALHVGYLPLRYSSPTGANGRVLLWKWTLWGGPGQMSLCWGRLRWSDTDKTLWHVQCVQWQMKAALDGGETHEFILKGRLASSELQAAGMLSGTEKPEPSRRAFIPKAQRIPGRTFIREKLSKATLRRSDADGAERWQLEWATSKNAAPLPPLMLQPGEDGCFSASAVVYKERCTVWFDTTKITPQASSITDAAKRSEAVALIHFAPQEGQSGLTEVSRGLFVSRDWCIAAAALQSKSEHTCQKPRAQDQQSAAAAEDAQPVANPQDESIVSTNPLQWAVSLKTPKRNGKEKRRLWEPLQLPAKIDGAILLDVFGLWCKAHSLGIYGAVRRGRGLLHSHAARSILNAAYCTIDAPMQLIVDAVVGAMSGPNDPALLQLVHAVVGAMEHQQEPSSQQPVCTYIGPQRDLGSAVLDTISQALSEMNESLKSTTGVTVTSGLCRLPLKVLKMLQAQTAPEETGCAGLQTCELALRCCATALSLLQAAAVGCELAAARVAAAAVAVEICQQLRHQFTIPDSTELLHWLSRGGEWHACEGLATHPKLQAELVAQCYSIRNTKAAARYEHLYCLTSRASSIENVLSLDSLPKVRDGEMQCLTLHSDIEVMYICDSASLALCIEQLKQAGSVIGLDAEWKPFDHGGTPSPVSLLQLASYRKVWLVDLLQLRSMLPASASSLDQLWLVLGKLTVVGFGLRGDLSRLAETSLPGALSGLSSAVELQGIVQGKMGLDALCRAALGVCVDKTNQTSDWSIRPLSPEQLQYAAIDAYVLLLILGAISAIGAIDMLAAQERVFTCSNEINTEALCWARPVTIKSPASPQHQHVEIEPLTTADVQIALEDLGFEHSQVVCAVDGVVAVKSIALEVVDVGLVICVLMIDDRLHLSRVASILSVKRSDVRLVHEAELVARVGFPRHCIGPVASRTKATVLVDAELECLDSGFLCGAGGAGVNFQTCAKELVELLSATVANITY